MGHPGTRLLVRGRSGAMRGAGRRYRRRADRPGLGRDVERRPGSAEWEATGVSTVTYGARGLVCGLCVGEVIEHVRSVAGVTGVTVDLVRGGRSPVIVRSDPAVADDEVRTAVRDAGYAFAGVRGSPTLTEDPPVERTRGTSPAGGPDMQAVRI